MAATSFLPLIKRVEEVLVEGKGVLRTIPEDKRFLLGVWPDESPRLQRRDAHVRKRCWVTIESTGRSVGPPEMSTVSHYLAVVRIDFIYWVEGPHRHEVLREAIAEAADDMHRVRAALGFPSNLAATEASEETGLAGGALQMSSWANELLVEERDEGGRPVPQLRATMLLTGHVFLTNP